MKLDLSPNVFAAVLLTVLPSLAAAQSTEHVHPPQTPARIAEPLTTKGERPSVRAVLAPEAPKIDGVLDEAVWQSASPIDTFIQQEPLEGQPASDRTEVRVLYDQGHLFIGVHAYASLAVVATEMRRDADRLFDEDNFQVILDTFHDSRNAFMFLTTPLGAKLEQQVFDEGEGGGRGTTSNVNRNWDGVWEAAARITPDGWTAEISIPVNTLRFAKGDEQVWGLNFQRGTSAARTRWTSGRRFPRPTASRASASPASSPGCAASASAGTSS